MTPPRQTPAKPSPEVEAALKQVELRINAAKDFLRALEKERRAIGLVMAHQVYGLSIGCKALNREGNEIQVCEINTTWSTPWVYAYPFKRNGELSKHKQSYYSGWTVQEPGPPPPPIPPPTPYAPI